MSAIIKCDSPEADSVRPAALDGPTGRALLGAAEALSAVERIMRQAEETLAEAKRRAGEIEREAYQKGFAQGEKAGMALGQQRLEPTLKAFSQLVEEIATLRGRLIAENDKFILQMGLLAAAEILHDEITTRDEAVLGNVRAALEKVVRGATLRLRVSPHDFKLVQLHLPLLLNLVANREDFHLEADAEIARGGCFLSTDAGDIDAQIDTQLAVMRQRLLSEE
ncbi:MAG: FliH/SctL family protein [Candidatus Sumerlaeota bacterium]|nr:FliH/SctL family protein [Candidatus Sumerlaeota bacterium]